MTQPEFASETSFRPKRTARPSRSAGSQQSASVAEPGASDSLTEQDIRLRAYYLFLERNGQPGDPVADWLRAEHEAMTDLPEASE